MATLNPFVLLRATYAPLKKTKRNVLLSSLVYCANVRQCNVRTLSIVVERFTQNPYIHRMLNLLLVRKVTSRLWSITAQNHTYFLHHYEVFYRNNWYSELFVILTNRHYFEVLKLRLTRQAVYVRWGACVQPLFQWERNECYTTLVCVFVALGI